MRVALLILLVGVAQVVVASDDTDGPVPIPDEPAAMNESADASQEDGAKEGNADETKADSKDGESSETESDSDKKEDKKDDDKKGGTDKTGAWHLEPAHGPHSGASDKNKPIKLKSRGNRPLGRCEVCSFVMLRKIRGNGIGCDGILSSDPVYLATCKAVVEASKRKLQSIENWLFGDGCTRHSQDGTKTEKVVPCSPHAVCSWLLEDKDEMFCKPDKFYEPSA